MKKGFTLIEIIVALAIVGILAVAAVTRYAGSLKKARAAECEATRYIVTDADERYAVEHDGSRAPSLQALHDAGYLHTMPVCASGGTYAWASNPAGQAGRRLACSIHGDTLPGNPGAMNTITAPPSAPKSQADCPAGTVFMPRIYSIATKNFEPVCAPECPPGQRRTSVFLVDSCKPLAAGNTLPAQGATSTQCAAGFEFIKLNNGISRCLPICPAGQTHDLDKNGVCVPFPASVSSAVSQPKSTPTVTGSSSGGTQQPSGAQQQPRPAVQAPAQPAPAAPCGYLPNGRPKPCPGHGHN